MGLGLCVFGLDDWRRSPISCLVGLAVSLLGVVEVWWSFEWRRWYFLVETKRVLTCLLHMEVPLLWYRPKSFYTSTGVVAECDTDWVMIAWLPAPSGLSHQPDKSLRLPFHVKTLQHHSPPTFNIGHKHDITMLGPGPYSLSRVLYFPPR